MPGFFDLILGPSKRSAAANTTAAGSDFAMAGMVPEPITSPYLDGTKYSGGFGDTRIYTRDYWTLRARSAQLFEDNLYARGLKRRMVTNVINSGLFLESTPRAPIIGLPWSDDQWTDWSEDVENRWDLWGADPRICDYQGVDTWSGLQQYAYGEAFVEGDILVVCRMGPAGVPRIQLIPGSAVVTPWGQEPRAGNRINMGVEKDPQGRVVAYWVREGDRKYSRLPAWGEKSGRRIAWLFYATDKRYREDRGVPVLQLILQSLRDLDRQRDAVQRKALINSILAAWVQKTGDRIGSGPLTGGAVRKSMVQGPGEDGAERKFTIAQMVPGVIMEELQPGEEIKAHGSEGTDIKFAEFETAIVSAMAWAHELPPEILTLAFRQNYSASRAAINELKSFLDREQARVADNFHQPIFGEWMTAMVAQGRIQAPGFLARVRSLPDYEFSGAWLAAEWNGPIKQSVDPVKDATAYQLMVKEGWITNDRAARDLAGMKFSRVIARQVKENQLKAAALEPLGGYNPTGASQPAAPPIDGDADGE